jgi:SAM-dependent methyltransferase
MSSFKSSDEAESIGKISEILRDHYRKTYAEHGPTSKGVDWGEKEWAALLRQAKMLEVIKAPGEYSILDVGCGYGGLADLIEVKKLNIKYTGIDLVEEMIIEGARRHPHHKFVCGDILDLEIGKYDFVICNGILTQKLSASILEMNEFTHKLIKKLFHVSKCGVAFNIMSTYVNYQKDNLYYRNPAELLAWCMSELTPHVKLDSAYDLWYEYTVYLYRREGLANV